MDLKSVLRYKKHAISSLWVADILNELRSAINDYPNDAELGAEIRKQIINLDN